MQRSTLPLAMDILTACARMLASNNATRSRQRPRRARRRSKARRSSGRRCKGFNIPKRTITLAFPTKPLAFPTNRRSGIPSQAYGRGGGAASASATPRLAGQPCRQPAECSAAAGTSPSPACLPDCPPARPPAGSDRALASHRAHSLYSVCSCQSASVLLPVCRRAPRAPLASLASLRRLPCVCIYPASATALDNWL